MPLEQVTTTTMVIRSLKEFFLIPVQFFQTATKLTYFSLGVATVMGILCFGIMFRRPRGFDDHPTLDLTDAVEREWTKWKLVVLGMICVGIYFAAYRQLPDWFPSFFGQQD